MVNSGGGWKIYEILQSLKFAYGEEPITSSQHQSMASSIHLARVSEEAQMGSSLSRGLAYAEKLSDFIQHKVKSMSKPKS